MTDDTAPQGAPEFDPLVPFNVKIPVSLKQAITARARRDHTSQRAAAIALIRAGVAADAEAQRRVFCAPGAHYAPASDVSYGPGPDGSAIGVCQPCRHLLDELELTPAEYLASRPKRED